MDFGRNTSCGLADLPLLLNSGIDLNPQARQHFWMEAAEILYLVEQDEESAFQVVWRDGRHAGEVEYERFPLAPHASL